jgi:hypothetical protein
MPTRHLPTQTAVIKALSKVLGSDQAVQPAHQISSSAGFYVARGLQNVSGPTILIRAGSSGAVVDMLEDLLTEDGWTIERHATKPEITVNFIPREAR